MYAKKASMHFLKSWLLENCFIGVDYEFNIRNAAGRQTAAGEHEPAGRFDWQKPKRVLRSFSKRGGAYFDVDFPVPIKVGQASIRFSLPDIESWLEGRISRIKGKY